MPLDPRLAADLRRRHEVLLDTKPVHRPDNLRRCYETFRRAFGPDVLESLSGEPLLLKLHERNTKDSLVYWLEFKSDDELPAIFGSISGGSAFKFGIYCSRETGEWVGGSGQNKKRLELAEAIAAAEQQRDQLVAGCRVLDRYAGNPEQADYAAIQEGMLEAAPDIADSSWGHKYFALCYPALLDDFHGASYQRFNLIKLLQTPQAGDDRYRDAGAFLSLARELGMPVCNLGSLLSQRNGAPHRYWRVGTRHGDQAARGEWPSMRDGGFAAIGWNELGDLSEVPVSREGKERIRDSMGQNRPSTPQQVGRDTEQVFRFLGRMQQRDVVLAADGQTILGVGRVTGDYYHETKGPSGFAHRRPVDWVSLDEWTTPVREGLRTTCIEMRKHAANLVEVERHLLDAEETPTRHARSTAAAAPLAPLSGHPARISSILKRKGQVILYGPPGTGKTYWAQKTARELVARSWFQRSWERLGDAERDELKTRGALEVCCFHPAYGYEEFLEGYRPEAVDGAMVFKLHEGLFTRLCDRARKDPEHDYVLIIDEINRGDVPRIFGELMTVLERSKRGEEISLPVSGRRFSVPGNVLVIATMNTADRSIALLDAALRRRFGFIELMPDYAVLGNAAVGGIPLGEWLKQLNERVLEHLGRDARNLQIGHSYLMHGAQPVALPDQLAAALHDDIVPLLEEHCYEDFETLGRILGKDLVHVGEQRIVDELFDPSRRDDLFQALLQAFQGLETAVTPQEAEDELEDDDTEDDSVE